VLVEEAGSAERSVTRVLIVDDHRAFSDALAIAIDAQADLRHVGVASTVEEAVEAVASSSPDVVLMDIRLPGVDGIEGVRRIKGLRPDMVILVLTGFADAETMAQAALAGASGFFPKERPVVEILEAIRTASQGGMVVDPATLAAMLTRTYAPQGSPAAPPGVGLTQREREVLAMMAAGRDPRAIARALGITVNTSRGHVKSVMAKLGAHSQLEAVMSAVRIGLLDVAALGPPDGSTGPGRDDPSGEPSQG